MCLSRAKNGGRGGGNGGTGGGLTLPLEPPLFFFLGCAFFGEEDNADLHCSVELEAAVRISRLRFVTSADAMVGFMLSVRLSFEPRGVSLCARLLICSEPRLPVATIVDECGVGHGGGGKEGGGALLGNGGIVGYMVESSSFSESVWPSGASSYVFDSFASADRARGRSSSSSRTS